MLMHARGRRGGSDVAVIKGTRGTAGSEKRQMKGKEGRGEKAAGSKNGKWNIKRLWGAGRGGVDLYPTRSVN